MNVTSATTSLYATLFGKSSSNATASSSASDADATSAATSTTSSGSSTGSLDFTNMTGQQMFDWMNSQLKSGQMTFEQSSAFLGMTLKVDVSTGQTVDPSTDTTRYNFMDIAQQGLAGALSRHDDTQASLLKNALAIMQDAQGASSGVDITV